MVETFQLGPLNEAALTILECLDVFGTSSTIRYKIRYHCCSKEGTLLHRSILRRIARGFTLCRDCGTNGSPEDIEKARQIKLEAGLRVRKVLVTLSKTDLVESITKGKFVAPPWPVPSRQSSIYVKEREHYRHQC